MNNDFFTQTALTLAVHIFKKNTELFFVINGQLPISAQPTFFEGKWDLNLQGKI